MTYKNKYIEAKKGYQVLKSMAKEGNTSVSLHDKTIAQIKHNPSIVKEVTKSIIIRSKKSKSK